MLDSFVLLLLLICTLSSCYIECYIERSSCSIDLKLDILEEEDDTFIVTSLTKPAIFGNDAATSKCSYYVLIGQQKSEILRCFYEDLPKPAVLGTLVYLVGCGNSSLVEAETFVLVRLGCALFAFNAKFYSHLTWILCINSFRSPVFTSVLRATYFCRLSCLFSPNALVRSVTRCFQHQFLRPRKGFLHG